jgi:hypothetical protein
MRKSFLVPVFAGLVAIGVAAPAHAKPGGCVKGAIVGGIAGHFAGHHGAIGAAAGCAYGVHERHKYQRQEEGRSSYQQHGANKQHGY